MTTPMRLMTFPEHYPEQFEQMGQIIGRELLLSPELNLTFETANQKAFMLVEAIRRNMGGGAVYFPRAQAYELSLREQQIWNDYHGNNIPELSVKYELSQMQIRNIIARARARDTAKRQAGLF